MKPNKRIAAAAAVVMAVAGVATLGAQSSALAASTNLGTLLSEPVNLIGTAAYNANIGVNPVTANGSLTAAQVGDDVQVSINLDVGPKASAAAVAGGTYQYEFDITDNGAVVLSGDQCETNGALGAAVLLGDNYSGIGGASPIPTLVCTIASPLSGSHTYEIRNMNINGNGASSGSSFNAPRVGFDANTNRSAAPGGPANGANSGNNFVPTSNGADWGVASTVSVIGANAVVSSISGQVVTTHVRPGGTINVTGTNWTPSTAITAVTVNGTAAASNTLSVDGSGNLTGGIVTAGGTTTGAGNIVITQGSKVSNTAITVLAPAAATLSSASAGLGATVTVTGTTGTWDPNTAVSIAAGASTASGTANASGGFSIGIVVNDAAATAIVATQGANVVSNAFTVLADKCTAQTGNTTGGVGCSIDQSINVSITAGNLSQRHYNNPTTASGNNGPGTPNVNAGNQTVNLGTVVSPSSPLFVYGTLNDITVTDARGGSFGWSLTATMTNFTSGANSINANLLQATPSCSTATAANAWDYNATSKAAIAGYTDPWASTLIGSSVAATVTAPGLTSTTPLRSLNNTVGINLCTKNTTLNNFGTTSGVFNVISALRLTVPAFQANGTYSAVMTVKLV